MIYLQKEYECQTCKKPFKAKNRLTRHEKEVHMVSSEKVNVKIANTYYTDLFLGKEWKS